MKSKYQIASVISHLYSIGVHPEPDARPTASSYARPRTKILNPIAARYSGPSAGAASQAVCTSQSENSSIIVRRMADLVALPLVVAGMSLMKRMWREIF